MPNKLEIKPNHRGSPRAEFKDKYESQASIQDSTIAGYPMIWLGVDRDPEGNTGWRMHLTQEMVQDLMPLLTAFIETGSIAGQPAT